MLLRVALLLMLVPLTASAQSLTHGPYLQSLDEDSVVIRWRTSAAEDSYVNYGPASDDLDTQESAAPLVTEHEITLSSLTAATTYFYNVGDVDTVWAGGDADHFFTTPPATGTATPVTVWAMADTGFGGVRQAATRDGFLTYMAGATAQVWLIVGDVAYSSGTDAEYSSNHFQVYDGGSRPVQAHTPVWPTPGSHDTIDAAYAVDPDAGPYFDVFTLPAASGSEAYYSYDYGDVHFVSINTAAHGDNWSVATLQAWLIDDLAGSDAEWTIAYWYEAVYTGGKTYDSDVASGFKTYREALVPIVEAAGVDLVLGGHAHIYERSMFLKGHTGISTTFSEALHAVDAGDGDPAGDGVYRKQAGCSNCGTVYATIGSGGWNKEPKLSTKPMHVVSLDGSEITSTTAATTGQATLVLEIDGLRLDGRLIDEAGAVLDHFTIMKSEEWSSTQLSPWSGANYIPDADTRSPTLHTGRCRGITVSCWGTTLSSLLQTCNKQYLYADGLDITQCQDVDQIAIDCASLHSVQIDPAPEFIRMKSGTNYGNSQYFRAFCNGTN